MDRRFSKALSGEFDTVGVVDEAIEDGVGDGRIADDFVPAVDGDLAGDDGRSPLISIFDDLQEIAPLIIVELFWSPIIQNEKIGPCEGLQ